MKEIKYIIAPAIALFMFAACNTEVKGPSQAELDAQVDAKVKSATDQLKSECDSRIMSAAQLKKDSILVKLGKQKPAPAAAKPAPTPKAPVKAPPVKVEPVKAPPAKVEPPKGNQGKVTEQNATNQGKIGGKDTRGEEIVPVNHGKKR